MPFQFEQYRNPYVQSISDLMQEPGRASAHAATTIGNAQAQGAMNSGNALAQAAAQRGAAYAGAVNQIGQTVAAIPQQMVRAKEDALRTQILQQQAGAGAQQIADLKALDNAVTQPGGRDAIIAALPGHLRGQVQKQFEEADARAMAMTETRRKLASEEDTYTQGLLKGIQAHNYDPSAAQLAISHAKQTYANDPNLLKQITQIEQAVQANPTPSAIKTMVDPLVKIDVDAEAKKKADLGKTVADTARAQAEAEKLKAETTGTLPATPANAEAARHNKEMERIALLTEGKQAAAQAETARHNRETEKAANPLGSMLAPSGASGGANGPASEIHGEEFIQKLNPGVATTVKALADGRMAFPTGAALRSPYWQGLLTAVGQYDPTFDAVNYNARSKTRADFTSGKSAASVNALNTVLGHLDKLSDAAEALGNSDMRAYNTVTNYFSKAFGSPTVTNFETIKKAVADEVTKVWRQSGGSVEDVRAAQANLDAAGSPDQLRGAIATYGELLGSKLSSLQDQYKQGMGTDAVKMIRPESQAVLDKIAGRATGGSRSASAPAQKSLSVDQVKQIADRMGVTYAEAKKNAESKGLIVR